MITVRRNGTNITITGHAGSAEYGKDLVCASASILFYTLVENLDRLQRESKCKVQVKALEGDAGIKCIPGPGYTADVVAIFNSITVGYEILAEEYPEYLKVTI